MTEEERFGRQPKPVALHAVGEQQDIDHYLRKIKSFIENSSYDIVTHVENRITIYPRAVND